MSPTVQEAADVLADRLVPAAPLAFPATAMWIDDDTEVPAAAASLRARRRIVIGVLRGSTSPAADVVAACDLILAGEDGHPSSVPASDLSAEVDRVFTAIGRNPYAAVVLADVLRAAESAPVIDALHVESLAYSALLAGSEFRAWLDARAARTAVVPDRAPVRVERSAADLHLVFDHPERRNAYSAAMRDALVDALSLAEADDTITRVLISGEGPSFCAGGDLTEFGTNPDGAQSHLLRTRGGAGALMHRLAAQVQVTVHGSCIGAGIELPAFASTLRVRGEATFRLPEVHMGLIPGAGGTVSIPRRIGRHRAYWLAVTGAAINASTALEWGLVDAVDPEG
ncbi:enoyl-CoA hydratase/isomerase family protein [Microbacterium sp. zg-Y818]|uniref:enoyl-CoA hydratase/isomerase family protein n=1 Tax=unclassified Microbacterium TaxID=2609290 RepID=UPI00214C283A|nr:MULTISPECIES: enoyl-CoA hydratase/isomerase family protein [unclassified Microbacterium]MCR2799360.1 enoyl-CoA hydratase/isomerase family protein [Microbacterium sp. zg.Y818]WIM21359.1 enoyl-CoA hydratase/isomerase family protein [Microbacterium sp. zg-Y818]